MSGRVIEVVFSMDCTCSMEPCINEMKQHVQNMVTRLQRDIPGIRIALVAHGDYPNEGNYLHKFLIKSENFTTDVARLSRFISELEVTNGVDTPEAYELALQTINGLSWTPGSQRVAVVIGDEVPHEPGSDRDKRGIDWRAEADKLVSKSVKIHGVQCLDNGYATPFYKALAEKSGGSYLRLGQFENIRDLVMAVCYRESGVRDLEDYKQEVIQRSGPLNRDMAEIFAALRQ